ncbi:hypothetical protein HAL011_09090 [Helicobacter ailurogastricus]|uniref:Uncharacterized protein n=1 Tax=Helicobacter ailurogastricus TaxID=1578720 RepID=A0A0K2X2W1_9HELI|nr:hypothetical protein HAL011_09090 [Helicobacter ailurogastricus]
MVGGAGSCEKETDIVDFCKQRHTTQPKNLPPIRFIPQSPKTALCPPRAGHA